MTPGQVDFEPSHDGLYRDVPLGWVVEVPVMGVPVRFETNSESVRDAVEESFGCWHSLHTRPDLLANGSLRVRLIVHPGDEGETEIAQLRYRMPDNDRFIVLSPGSVAMADVGRREGFAYVTPALVADRAHFCYGVLEALTLVLVTAIDRHPLHAAGLVRGNSALLLHGPSGTGKSTVSYAAARAGLEVLSEDVTYLQLEPVFRVWGVPGRIHLPEDVRERFPELRAIEARVLANGKRKTAVDLPLQRRPLPVEGTTGVCLLRRGAGRSTAHRTASRRRRSSPH